MTWFIPFSATSTHRQRKSLIPFLSCSTHALTLCITWSWSDKTQSEHWAAAAFRASWLTAEQNGRMCSASSHECYWSIQHLQYVQCVDQDIAPCPFLSRHALCGKVFVLITNELKTLMLNHFVLVAWLMACTSSLMLLTSHSSHTIYRQHTPVEKAIFFWRHALFFSKLFCV